MSYVALYRKARPQTFDEVIGQDAIVRTLKNQVLTGRVQHAYLFCGTRGTGKTSVAKILARAVNCEHPEGGNPCNSCEMCREIRSGNSMNVIEIDAASNNGVDNIRQIIEEVQYRPTRGRYKVYIIDEVHMLSAGAFNALLKTLEEPPSYVIFILATTEAGRIPVTILSRCQRYDFHRISSAEIVSHMQELLEKEQVEAEERALAFIARASEGSMRDALSLLDECMAFYMGQKLTYEKVLAALGEADTEVFGRILRKIVQGDAAGCIRLFEKQMAAGTEAGQFVSDFIWYLRNLLLVATGAGEGDVDVTSEQLQELKTLSAQTSPEAVMRMIRVLSDLQNNMRFASNRRVPTEVALIRLCRPQMEGGQDTAALLERVSLLEKQLAAVLDGTTKVHVEASAAAQEVPPQTKPAENEETPEHVPSAAPEELKEIAAGWAQIVGMLSDGFAKTVLRKSRPQYNTDTDDHTLHIELTAELGERIAGNPDVREELERLIERQYGRHVDVEMHMKKDRTSNLADISLDEILEKNIGMQITEEEN